MGGGGHPFRRLAAWICGGATLAAGRKFRNLIGRAGLDKARETAHNPSAEHSRNPQNNIMASSINVFNRIFGANQVYYLLLL